MLDPTTSLKVRPPARNVLPARSLATTHPFRAHPAWRVGSRAAVGPQRAPVAQLASTKLRQGNLHVLFVRGGIMIQLRGTLQAYVLAASLNIHTNVPRVSTATTVPVTRTKCWV